MSGLRINLFGKFQVWRGAVPIEPGEWGRQKTRALLKLLLTGGGRVFSRDEILEALWPDVSPAAAERSLRVTVSLLRRALEPDLERGAESRYVLGRRPGYLFDSESGCAVDTWEFDERRRRAQAARDAGRLEEAIREYREADRMSCGEFLAEDPYEEWASEPRRAWGEARLTVLCDLSECLALRGGYGEAVEVCARALALDRYREESHRQLMLYHYCSGEQTLALRTFRSYARMLKEELGATPSPEMGRLREQIEARNVPGVDTLRRYPKPRRPLRFPYSLSRTHFAGRGGEYAWLCERLEESARGAGGAVAVEGEAGVGKTRLVEEFLGYARSRGAKVFAGRCYERELGPLLEPVMEAVGGVAKGIFPAGSGSAEETGNPWRAGFQEDGARVYQSLVGRIIEEARDECGLVLFVDDVQWADAATLEFLSYLARRIGGQRVLVVFTYRREDAAGISVWLDRLAERRSVSTLSLDRLSGEDTAEILGRMSARGFGELDALAEFLHRESEGNPFYTVEYLRWLIETGAVEIDSRRRISGLKDESLRTRELPSGVRSLLRARFSGLEQEPLDLLKAAAVIGRGFDLGLLCAITGDVEGGIPGMLDSLLGAVLISGSETDSGYHFSHDKLRQTLYEDIGPHRRRELHLRVADALASADGEPAELAHHYLQAREWQPALKSLMRAARQAEESYAWESALADYARALEVVDRLPEAEETKFELQTAREHLLEHLDRREERAEAVEEMFELAKRLGEKTRLAEVHIRRIGVLMALPNPEGAAEAGETAVSLFRELGDSAGEARAHRELGYARWMSRDYAGALESNFGALWIHRALGYREAESGDASNIAQVYRGMKNYDQALRWAEAAVRIDRDLGNDLGEGFKVNTVANIHSERGDLQTALALHLESLRICKGLGIKNLIATQHMNCGRLSLSLDSPEKAIQHFRAAANLSEETGYTRDGGYSFMGLGLCLERIGKYHEAAESHRRAIESLRTAYEDSALVEDLSGKAEALKLLGRLFHGPLQEPAKALGPYEEAAGIHRDLDNPVEHRKVLMDLAGVRWKAGSLEQSAREYEAALELARAHGETSSEAAALASLSVVYRDLGRLKDALRCGREALALLRRLQERQAEAYVLTSLADSYVRLGHHPSAVSCLKRSLRLRREIGDEEGELRALQDLDEVYEARRGKSERETSAEASSRVSRAKEG